MADQPSLSAAMGDLTLVQGSTSTMRTQSGQPQNINPCPRQSDILGEWEHDRFGTKISSCSNTEIEQERSTVSSWRAFAQSNTSKQSPLPRSRDGGKEVGEVWRKENGNVGDRNQSARLKAGAPGPRLPTLPALPELPTTPPQGQTQAETRGPTKTLPVSRPQEPPRASREVTPQDPALHKRKSEKYLGQNGCTSAEEPQFKRVSPDRQLPLAASPSSDIANNGETKNGEATHRQRRPSFERWISSRARPHFVAPNGTTIIPSQPKSTGSQQAITTYQHPRVAAPNAAPTTPASQPTPSSRNHAPPISQPQAPSNPPQIISSINQSTPTIVAGNFTTTSPPKSRAKTTDDTARRLIFASLGIGRAPKRTEEELEKRQREQEKRRLQREERERLGHDEVMKWCGTPVEQVQMKPSPQMVVKEDLFPSDTTKPGPSEAKTFKGESI